MERTRAFTVNDNWLIEFARKKLDCAGREDEVVEITEWRNSTIYKLNSDSKTKIVKLHKFGNFENLQRWSDELSLLRRGLQGMESSPKIPTVLALNEKPLASAMEFIEGQPGATWLYDKIVNRDWGSETQNIMKSWGRALACFHRASLSNEDFDSSLRIRAETRYLSLWKRFRFPLRLFSTLRTKLIPCRLHNDVGFHNVIIQRDGRLAFIDFFEKDLAGSIHEDVAHVITWLNDAYRDCGRFKRSSARRILTQAFLAGYEDESNIKFNSRGHRELILFFQLYSNLNWVMVASRRKHYTQVLDCAVRSGESLARLTTSFYRLERMTP